MPISFDGIDSLIARLEGMQDGILEAARVGMEDGLLIAKADAQKNCPVDTSDLRGSIQSQSVIVDGAVEGKMYSPLEYAGYVEMGTGPKGEADHAGTAPIGVTYRTTGWTYHDEKGFHYTRGQPARPYLYPAFKANKRVILGKIMEAVRKVVKGG